ncbi:hypothetical protein [Roseomonas harenae]|uniref:hypothetical protein n=1 Tax=Muricoccus harenae TaxID=2692566 RepID=UPI001331A5C4|nr:hypothetical protein [Roseomonas harenae]
MTFGAQRRGVLTDIALILLASVATVALFAILRRLGLPFGLRIGAMGEDYNWLLILSAPNASARAQAFWAMNDRNPLSPWWYIPLRALYANGANGPYLTRLLVQPLLGVSVYLMVWTATQGRARGIALGAGMLSAAWVLHTSPDQIAWNFIGALSLSCLSIAAFAAWVNGGRRAPGWYGLSLFLWFAAFGSYTFQVGAVVGIGLLSLLHPAAPQGSLPRRLAGTAMEVLPYPLLLAAFVLAWKTTQNPAMAEYYALNPSLLLRNLPSSLWEGVALTRYIPFAGRGMAVLGWAGIGLAVLFGLAAAGLQLLVLRSEAPARLRDAALVLAITAGLVLPTLLIESMSGTWTVGLRWPMVDQGWRPLLWTGAAALLCAALPLSARFRKLGLAAVTGVAAGWLLLASLGYNNVQSVASAHESAMRAQVAALAARVPPGAPFNFVILVEEGVRLVTPDVMSYRVAPIWFLGRDFGLRVLQHDEDRRKDWDREAWSRVVLEDGHASNLRIGPGTGPFPAIRILRFDGRHITIPPVLDAADFAGYPVHWLRSRPLRQDAAIP